MLSSFLSALVRTGITDSTLNGLFERHEIRSRGDLYMVRWVLAGHRMWPEGRTDRGRLFLHRILRSDNEEALHDHPWAFWSLILAGGYWEHTERGRRWYGPGRILRRPAGFRHRIVVERPAWSLVWTGPKERSWFFHCPAGPVHWRQFLAAVDAGGSGCA